MTPQEHIKQCTTEEGIMLGTETTSVWNFCKNYPLQHMVVLGENNKKETVLWCPHCESKVDIMGWNSTKKYLPPTFAEIYEEESTNPSTS